MKDSGPAFPTSGRVPADYDGHNQGWCATEHPGMTLRDYFAAKAMASLATYQEYPPAQAAVYAYEYADAMLKARKE